MRQLSAEGVLGLNPSLVLAVQGSGPKETMDVLEAAKVPLVLVPETFSEQGLLDKIKLVGHAMGADKRAECLTAVVTDDLAQLRELRAKVTKPVRVMFDQLRELTARIMSRRLDPDRPLWEVYFVEGLEDGRVARALQVPPDPRRRHLHRRPRPGAARRRPRSAPARARRLGRPARADARPAWRSAPSPSPRAHPRVAITTLRSNAEARGPHAERCRRQGRRDRRRAVRRRRTAPESPFNIEPSAQRRRGAACAPRSRTTARSGASTAAPSTTSSWPRCPAPSGRG